MRRLVGKLRSKLNERRRGRRSDTESVEDVSHEEPVPVEDDTAEPEVLEMTGDELGNLINSKGDFILLDIRESYELAHGILSGSVHIPMNSIPDRLGELPDKESKLIVYCAHGVRSFGVTAWLREQGWVDTWSLAGGLPGAPSGLHEYK